MDPHEFMNQMFASSKKKQIKNEDEAAERMMEILNKEKEKTK